MSSVYLCRACCEKKKIEYPFSIENKIARKTCFICNDNDDDLYLVDYDDELGIYPQSKMFK